MAAIGLLTSAAIWTEFQKEQGLAITGLIPALMGLAPLALREFGIDDKPRRLERGIREARRILAEAENLSIDENNREEIKRQRNALRAQMSQLELMVEFEDKTAEEFQQA